MEKSVALPLSKTMTVCKTRFSGHLCARLLRTLANVTKQTTLPTIWEWAQQQGLVVDLTMVASNWDVNERSP
jgi:hypothetical protein